MVQTQAPLSLDLTVGEQERALARAVIYRYLSIAYRYPSHASLEELWTSDRGLEESLAVLREAAALLDTDWHQELSAALATASCQELEASFIRLFGHTVQGSCPPYESEYGDHQQALLQPHELGDIVAFFRAFGLDLSQRTGERADFIGVECEFLSFLCQKQAYALEQGDENLSKLTLDIRKEFLCAHLGRWVPAFTRRLLQKAREGFYHSLARFTAAFIHADCHCLGIQTGPDRLRVRLPVFNPSEAFTCPAADNFASAGPGAILDEASE